MQLERGHVLVAQQAAVGLHEGIDAMRDFAAIEEIAHCVDRGGAGSSRGQGFLFGGGHASQSAREIRLVEDLAGQRDAAVWEERLLGIGPQVEEAARARDGAGAHFIDGHAVGQFDGGLNLFRERLGPEIAQRD